MNNFAKESNLTDIHKVGKFFEQVQTENNLTLMEKINEIFHYLM